MTATSGRRPAPLGARLAVGVPAVLLVLLLVLPLAALVTRTPPGRVLSALGDRLVLDALRISLETTAAATLVIVLLGTPLAVLLARGRAPGLRLLEALVGLPLVLPPVVAGLALLVALGRTGPYAPLLDAVGLHLPFTVVAVVVAQVFVAAPYLVYTVAAGLRRLDPRLDEVASTLGAGPWRVFRTVTLPALAPALGAGVVLSAARALGEFGATITVAGNLPGTTQTVPTAIYTAFEQDPDGAYALATILVVVSLALLVALRGAVPLRAWAGARPS